MMLAGISTACFYPQYTEQALEQIIPIGPQCLELFVNAACELEIPYLTELRKRADDAGIKILSIHPYTSGMEPMFFFSNYDRRYEEGLELYKKYYQAANLLGAGIVVFHGAMRVSGYEYDSYFERFARLWEDGMQHGVEICQENVQRCTSYCPAFFTAMSHALPDVGYVLDVKQAVRSGEDVYSFAQAMGRRVRHIHISVHNPNQDCLPPGAGVLNIPKLLNIIGKNGFSGGVIVELYRHNFGSIVEINRGYQHLCTALSTVSDNN